MGEYRDNYQSGKGTYYFCNFHILGYGETYIGDFLKSKKHGYGKIQYKSGSTFEG